MVSDIEQDDEAFRATISNEYELFTTTFEDGSPASNVEKALWNVLSQHKTKLKMELSYRAHHQVAQGIRVILKDWREYRVSLGEEYLQGEQLDSFTLGYSTMHQIGEDMNKQDSLGYKIAHCFTAEMKVHSQRKDFTQDKLQGIINGATKAYLGIVEDAELEYGEQSATGLRRDPKPSMATYSAVLPNLSGPSESESAFASTKRKAPLSDGGDDEQVLQEDKKRAKKPCKQKGTTVADDQQDSSDAINAPLSSPSKETRGPGNFGHGKPSMWSDEEDKWARGMLEKNPELTFQQLSDAHNQHWEGTVWTNAKNVAVTRGKRTKGAMQERFKTFRQDLRAKAPTNAGSSAKINGQPAAEEEAGGEEAVAEEAVEDRPQADSSWVANPTDEQDEEGSLAEVSSQYGILNAMANVLQQDEDEDEDPLDDLKRAVDGGESFEADGDE